MNISNLSILAEFNSGIKKYDFTAPTLTADGITFALEQREDTYRLTAKSDAPLGIRSLTLEFTYQGDFDFESAYVARTSHWESFGYHKVDDTPPESLHYGVVLDDKSPCFFIGTMLPQNTLQNYCARVLKKDTLRITAKVQYQRGQAEQRELFSEWVWLSDCLPYRQTIEAWAQKQPLLEKQEPLAYGWNSWDYYFETVCHEDIVENVEAIKADPVLREKVQYITVDDGWSHDWGVWEPNYRFAKGMKHTADYIKAQGFIPGIWTAPFNINFECYYARRCPELLVKDEKGDIFRFGRRCFIDPTCPAGEKYFFDLYKGLYDAGYRLFKIDFISTITNCPGFYRKDLGYYEVIRRFFEIVRSAIGADAKILGCNFPAELGGNIVEFNRAALDIHNDWNVVRRVVLSLQTRFWWPEHIATIDGDFMIVRGSETSKEDPANILPIQLRAGGEDIRLFDATEAQTWANLVAFWGGNRMNADRVSALNEKGVAILREGFNFPAHPHYRPLDLGRKELAEYWYKKTEDAEYLLLVNFEDTPQELGKGIDLPFAIEPMTLAPHESVIFKK